MQKFLPLLMVLLPSAALSEAYKRPIPQAQSATAEFWFLLASIALVLSLWVVNWMIKRR